MEVLPIKTVTAGAVSNIADTCGEVALVSSEVGGIVNAVCQSSETLRAEHELLHETIRRLEEDQSKVADACDESQLLSEKAINKLQSGTALISSSLGQIGQLVELVDSLTRHVTGFAAAMEQVRKSAGDINQIAETTNILALNASIEAMRAGDTGRTFAVVANEVKQLASETRRATDEIHRTVDDLDRNASNVVSQIGNSSEASGSAKSSINSIEDTINGVVELVDEVGKQNEQIAGAAGTIDTHSAGLGSALTQFTSATLENESKLSDASRYVTSLEDTASELFDRVVHADLAADDSRIVEIAREYASQISDAAQAGLESGIVKKSDFFDDDYQLVDGTNPEQFRTRLSDWADDHWRPILDACLAMGRPIKMLAVSDRNGFFPTHVSERSLKPTGDIRHDTLYCRNGRIMFGPSEKRAKANNAPYMMAAHRQEGDGVDFYIVRTIYMPLYVDDTRWGDLELAYILDDSAWPKA